MHLIEGVSYEHMPPLYSGADLFVFPSYIETFGLPLVEAMASGLPVVASDASCIPEICQNGALYFDPFNVEEMADKMALVLQDRELRQGLRRRAVARSKDFSWGKTARETLAVFENVASDPRIRESSSEDHQR